MATYYIESKDGNYYSLDGKRRFLKLTGKQAYDYLNGTEGKGKEFFPTGASEDGRQDEYVEIPAEYVQEIKSERNHTEYLTRERAKSGYIDVSLYAEKSEADDEGNSSEEELLGVPVVGEPDCDVETQAMHNIDIAMLREALKLLPKDEMELIYNLYLREEPMTVRAVGAMLGVHYGTISKRAKEICAKLKNYMLNNGNKN